MGCVEKNKKVGVVGLLASILLLASSVPMASADDPFGGLTLENIGNAIVNSGLLKVSVEALCAQTDYKDSCRKSLANAKNTSDPKELIKVAFTVTEEHISDAISKSELIKEAAKDPRTSGALETCKEVLHYSIDDLKRSFDNMEKINVQEIAKDLRVWLSAAVTHQQTCLDAFQNTTGDTGEKMKQLLKTTGELTSNGLAMVTEFNELMKALHSHRKLEEESESESESSSSTDNNEDFPEFVDGATRRLLAADPAHIKPNAVVAKDGSGQFKTINAALSSVPANNNRYFVIYIKAGVYNEYVMVPRKVNKVVFLGQGPTVTKITGNKNFIDGVGTYKTATVAVQGDGFVARDLAIENSAGPAKHQAVALRVSADMVVVHNCHLDGYQDTLYTHSYRQFYRACTITGTIDFIFGDAPSVFQNCKMVVRKPLENQACMVTAQGRKDRRGVSATVLQNCSILPDPLLKTVHPPVQVFLGRPWKEFSRTIIMNSYIDSFIVPEGWSPWMGNFALDTCFYAEYKNRGPGASTAHRVNWKGYKKNFTPQMAQQFTPGVYLDGDKWIRPVGIPYFSGMMN